MSTESSDNQKLSDGTIFGIGNPLLYIIAEVPASFLEGYNLKANDAILATEEQTGLVECLLRDHPNHQFVAGGATQNSLRASTWLLQQPNVCVFMGCVGQDKYQQLLNDAASKAGLILSYQVRTDPEERIKTGTCAILITDNNRSLVANLGAANYFTIEHLNNPKNIQFIEQAKIFYCAGFFYTVCPAAVMRICEHTDTHNKIFCTNLSAPYICDSFGHEIMKVMPYVDYLFGNETEAKSFGKHQLKLDTEDIKIIAKAISDLPKKNSQRKRVVIITQGSEPILLAITEQDVKEFPVKKPLDIVDTDNAGDAFVGGFLAYLALGKSHEESIQAGAYCAFECIQQSGCIFPEKPNFDPTTFVV